MTDFWIGLLMMVFVVEVMAAMFSCVDKKFEPQLFVAINFAMGFAILLFAIFTGGFLLMIGPIAQ